MTMHACLSRTGKTVVRRLAVLLAAVLILSGCTEQQRLFAVKAVAAGIPSLAPFFEEDGSLGRDRREVKPEQPHSGLQQGNTPGLYGGTRNQRVCDVERLKDFLTDPKNRQKAREWARIVGITPDRIEEYVDDLTPVLLRHDTLVKNHDYKKNRAVPYDALLEAGVAVLVNDQGLPAVKCSCGNPLKAFDKDPEKLSVEFDDGNKKWDGYEKSDVVTVKPSPRPLERIALLDVTDPDTAIDRPVGTTGEQDETFDATEQHEVPAVAGMTFAQASAALAELRLAVAYSGDAFPSGETPVTGCTPGPGTPLAFGAPVALSTGPDPNADSGSGSGSGDGTSPSPPTDPDDPNDPEGTDDTDGTESPSGGGTSSGAESSPGKETPSDTGTPSDKGSEPTSGSPSPSRSTPGGGTPTGAESTPPPPPDPTAPTVSSTPPKTTPPADPTLAEPTSSGPASSEPVSSGPGSPAEPETGGSGTGEAADRSVA
ncbi:DUF6777 domain-containing protein [Streptomyces sp. NPDC002701]|uniref:DUF6777 domain-containing protein n=1 Tax=Streptomyces sp. NPDC002701 TaxID=3364661 RepID=UPI0036CE5E20